jgi:UDP-N-acetylglucosamine:LPS N-acetylglucosamine transferase
MKKTVVLYPGLLASHFVPMMQLADALLEEGYATVVALIDVTLEEDAVLAAAVDRAAASKPSVTIHKLPRIQNPPSVNNDVDMLLGYFELLMLYNKHLGEFLCSLPPQSTHAVLVDSFSNAALDVAKELGIPAYSFFTTNASNVAVSLQLPWIRAEGQPSFRDLGGTTLNLHGVPPMPASHLILEMLEDPESEIYKAMTNSDLKNLEADGILVNTFTSLEARAVGSLKDPQFLRESGFTMPPVYCVGPLVGSAASTEENKHECLAWLDEQPEESVVFLCFGSAGSVNHSEEQLKEIAVGLERSSHRFLWVVRAPPGDNPDLHKLLPEGFLERTKGRGIVVKKWAPQVDVLHHKATGAFVTHCGWNSVLEGITAGVPMLCWPLYAEQKMNKVFMVEEAGIGVEVVGWQQELVKAEEVEAKVRLVLESEEGENLRARVTAHKEAAAAAWKNGGSSRTAFRQFLLDAAGNLKKELRHA